MEKPQHCRFCGSTEEKLIKSACVYNKKSGVKHQYYSCNPCNTLKLAKYRKTENGKRSVRAAVKRYERKNPIKKKSWRKVSRVPKTPCEVCGSNKYVDRHHPDSNKPMEIVMLCRKHHKKAHMV